MKIRKNLIAIIALAALTTSCYDFNRKQNELDAESKGRAILLEAESSKKAAIEEAKAKKESAALEAEARVIQAQGIADSRVINAKASAEEIEIISKQIQGNPDYLKFLMIDKLNKNSNKVYIPTEAGIPILEAK